jgi:CRP-like cAMP-binding protein/tetratricopeptide (TPR) repeat protein
MGKLERLFGRTGWVEEQGDRLRSQVVTFLGPGGIGKTSLARALAEERARGNSAWVDLIGCHEDDLSSSVSRQLGHRDFASALEELFASPKLVILDNAEHVATALSPLVESLASTGGEVWVTSRVPIPGFDQAALTVPGLKTSDAENLLISRMGALRFGWEPNEEELGKIRELAIWSGGNPLSLEILASAAATKTLAELGSAVGRIKSYRHPSRHQSMDAVVGASLSLVSAEARQAFGELSVFRTEFSAEEARALGVERQTLDSLVDGWLIEADLVGQSPVYHWREPLRDVSLGLLKASEREWETRRSHAQLMLERTSQQRTHLGHFQQASDIDELEIRWADYLFALETLIADRDPRAADMLSGIYMGFYLRRGRNAVSAIIERILNQCEAHTPAMAWLARQSASQFMYRGEYDDALERLELAVRLDPLAETLDSRLRSATVSTHVLTEAGRIDDASRHAVIVEELIEQTSNALLKVHGYVRIGCLRFFQGDLSAAEQALRRSSESEIEGHRKVGFSQMLLAHIRYRQGRFAGAGLRWRRQLVEHVRRGYKMEVATCLEGLAYCIARLGDPQLASEMLGTADRIYGECDAAKYSVFSDMAADRERIRYVGGPGFASAYELGKGHEIGPLIERIGAWWPPERDRVWSIHRSLASVPANERELASPFVRVLRVAKERNLYHEGDTNDGRVYIAVKGLIERWSSEAATPVWEGAVLTGGAFRGGRRPWSLRALAGAVLISIEQEASQSCPVLFRTLAGSEDATWLNVPPANADDRIFQYLAGFVSPHSGPWATIQLPLTQQQLADRTGLARETVSRTLHRLIESGRLRRVDRQTYQIFVEPWHL